MSKQQIIQLTTTGVKVLSALLALSAYSDLIPPKYTSVGILVFAVASSAKEVLTACNQYLEGPSSVQTPAVQAGLPLTIPPSK